MAGSKFEEKTSALDDLIRLIESLRGPTGCPWDRRQTPQSMLVYLIEEVYELADAIESEKPEDIREELGDVLFHIFFVARMFQEMGLFSIDDVADGVAEKMIRRHPHVFGSQVVSSPEDVVQNWQKIKMSEHPDGAVNTILDSVPSKLPALMHAAIMIDRMAAAGFDWKHASEHIDALATRLGELRSAAASNAANVTDRDLGDTLLVLIRLARRLGIHPESALAGSLKRFEKRFKLMEKRIAASGRNLERLSEAEKNRIWEQTKKLVP